MATYLNIAVSGNWLQKCLPLLWVWLACLGPSLVAAQQLAVKDHHLSLYEDRARQDAAYEQQIQWQTEEDEVDYWTDQRNFEKALQNSYAEGFQVYINSKRAAYMEHQRTCGDQCHHGDYYQLQASYYFQNGVPLPGYELYLATSSGN